MVAGGAGSGGVGVFDGNANENAAHISNPLNSATAGLLILWKPLRQTHKVLK